MTIARRLRIWRQRVRSVMRTAALDAELDRELGFHLDQLVAEKVAEGLSPEDARRAARLEFGNLAVVVEAARDQRHVTWFHDIVRDAAYGVRVLRRSPVFTAVTAASLALGIGANAAVLAAIDTTLLRGLPVADADRLVFIHNLSSAHPGERTGVSGNEFLAWVDGTRAFDSLAATLSGEQGFAGDRYGPAEQLRGLSVTSELFPILGAAPLAGRVFERAEARLVDPVPAIILSERLWRRRFAADPRIVGTAIRVGGIARTIVGVMPDTFRYQDVRVDFWVPLRLLREPAGSAGRPLRVIGRLKAGVTLAQGQADIDAMAGPLAASFPDRQRGWHAEVRRLDAALYGWARQPLLTLQIAVALVLLIACANVAALLLARGSVRQREINLRIALGAGRRRIVRQLLTESLMLSLAGGLLGLGVAWLGLRALSAMTPELAAPSLGPIGLDARVLAMTFGLSVLSALGFGMVPAFTASQADPIEVVRASSAERTTVAPRGSHAIIVSAQFALALTLMIGAGLLVKSSLRIDRRELHFDPDGVLMFDLALPVRQRQIGLSHGLAYVEIESSPAPMYGQVLDRVRHLGGVVSAGGSSYPAVNSLIIPTVDVWLDGSALSGPGRTVEGVGYFLVTPGFFATMRAPVVMGREVNDADTSAAPWVAIVNESAARRFWPGADPIGKRFILDTVPEEHVRRVVGVVPDIPLRHGDVTPRPMVYASYLQQPSRWRAPWRTLFGSMTFVVRTTGNPETIVPAVRRAVADIDPERPIASVGTVRQHLDAARRQFRYFVFLVTLLACTGGALAAIGVYGTVAYAASQRVREIGIRKALGASAWQLATLLARRAFVTIGAGVVVGLCGALVLTPLIASQLWGIAPTDGATYAMVSFLLVAVAAVACAVPVRRAIAVDPSATIRSD